MTVPPCNIKYFCGQMIAVCWSDLTWQWVPWPIISPWHRLLSWVWSRKNIHYVTIKNRSPRPTSQIPQQQLGLTLRHQPHPFDYWRGLGLCGFFHAYPFTAHIHNTTPPSQFLFVGQWCSGSDAAVAAASRRQLRTAGTGNLCQSHSPQTAVTKGKW